MAARERVYIVFHWAGLVFGFFVIVVFGAGFAVPSASEVLQTLGITLAVVGIVALIQSNDNLRGVDIVACRAVPVPAGEDVVLEVTLRNTAERERVGLSVRTGWRVKPRASTWVPVVEAGQTLAVRVALPTKRRGKFAIPQMWMCSLRPVGLCFAWKVFASLGDYYVYPVPRGRPLEVEVAESDTARDDGSEDVSGHRPYVPGDMLSRMDWRVFARSGKLVVRALEEGRLEEVVLRWSDTRHLADAEPRLEQLSFWIEQCVKERRDFRLDLGAGRAELRSDQLLACREALATFKEEG